MRKRASRVSSLYPCRTISLCTFTLPITPGARLTCRLTLKNDILQAMVCWYCGAERPLEAFAWRNKAQGRRQVHCRTCQSAINQRQYQANREKRLAQVRANWLRVKSAFDDLKRAPCSDCGQTFHPCQMDWDHRDGSVKVSSITKLLKNGRLVAARAELEKCDLVCANCHRMRTYQRLTAQSPA